jgi:hypothetical protein
LLYKNAKEITRRELPMKTNKQKTNLILDIFLFAGFILCFFLDLTGMILHQWLGVALVGFCMIHLLIHNQWVNNALRRFSDLQSRPQILFLLDAAVALGFVGILVTGLVISTWLNLPLDGYSTWLNVHIAFSIETLFFLVVKIGFHWRWISNTVRNLFNKRSALNSPVPQVAVPRSSSLPTLQSSAKQISRRDFLAVMGVTGLASVLAISSLLRETATIVDAQSVSSQGTTTQNTAQTTSPETVVSSTQVVSTSTSVPIATQAATVQPQTVNACSIRCNRRCSFPGHCHRYVDSNGTGLCDNGECL